MRESIFFAPRASSQKKISAQVGLRHERSFVENLLLGKKKIRILYKYVSAYFCQVL